MPFSGWSGNGLGAGTSRTAEIEIVPLIKLVKKDIRSTTDEDRWNGLALLFVDIRFDHYEVIKKLFAKDIHRPNFNELK